MINLNSKQGGHLMIHIVSDSSTLYSPAQAAAAGFHCVPLSVCVNDETYRDYDEITPRAMADACRKGAKVSSSQPAVGEKTGQAERRTERTEEA